MWMDGWMALLLETTRAAHDEEPLIDECLCLSGNGDDDAFLVSSSSHAVAVFPVASRPAIIRRPDSVIELPGARGQMQSEVCVHACRHGWSGSPSHLPPDALLLTCCLPALLSFILPLASAVHNHKVMKLWPMPLFFFKKNRAFFWKCKISGVPHFLGVIFISFFKKRLYYWASYSFLICIRTRLDHWN
jgi:hypothetical protein